MADVDYLGASLFLSVRLAFKPAAAARGPLTILAVFKLAVFCRMLRGARGIFLFYLLLTEVNN